MKEAKRTKLRVPNYLIIFICFNKINAGYINQQLYAMGKICEASNKQIREILFEKNNNESKIAVI